MGDFSQASRAAAFDVERAQASAAAKVEQDVARLRQRARLGDLAPVAGTAHECARNNGIGRMGSQFRPRGEEKAGARARRTRSRGHVA
jgi:hypothetical protein